MRRFLLTSLLLLTVLGPLAVSSPGPSAAAQSGGDSAVIYEDGYGFYISPTFNYLIPWKTDEWEVIDESSEYGFDVLGLQGPDDYVYFYGTNSYQGDPTDCIADAANQFAAQDGVSEFALARGEDGEPVVSAILLDLQFNPTTPEEAHRDTAIYTEVYTDDAGQSTDVVLQLECFELLPGSAVLLAVHTTSLDAWNRLTEGIAYDAPAHLMKGVVYPLDSYFGTNRDGYLVGPRRMIPCDIFPLGSGILTDAAGDDVALATAILEDFEREDQSGSGHPYAYVAIANISGGSLTLDLDGLFAEANRDSSSVFLESSTVFVSGDTVGSLFRLDPGGYAVVRVDITSAMYEVVIGYSDGDVDGDIAQWVSGGCGGGSRPRIRVA